MIKPTQLPVGVGLWAELGNNIFLQSPFYQYPSKKNLDKSSIIIPFKLEGSAVMSAVCCITLADTAGWLRALGGETCCFCCSSRLHFPYLLSGQKSKTSSKITSFYVTQVKQFLKVK